MKWVKLEDNIRTMTITFSMRLKSMEFIHIAEAAIDV